MPPARSSRSAPRLRSPRWRSLVGALLAATCLIGTAAHAQSDTFPSRPIRMIVAVGAGGATDTVARRLAERMTQTLGQTVTVENMPAGNGVIAAQTVARAAPDGHTILIGTNTTHAGNAAFMKSLPYDPIGDFEPIARLAVAALVLSLNNGVPAGSVREFISYAKANPGKVAFGSGTGSARLASELLKSQAGLDMISVPYKGNAAALTDLRSGQIQLLMGDIALMKPHIESGALKGLAVTGARRSAAMPQLPTMQEAGVPGYELVGFIASFAPARTPEPVVRRLNAEMTRILGEKDFAELMTRGGIDPAPTSPQELREWVVSETRKWTELARNAGIQPE